MFSWWLYVAKNYFLAFGDILKEGLSTTSGGFSINLQNHSANDIAEVLLSVFGFHLYVGLAIIGSFFMCSKRISNQYGFSLVMSGYLFVTIIFFSLMMGLVGILPGRWYVALQLVIAIQTAVGIYFVCLTTKSKIGKTIILSVFIILISFFMITDPAANMDNPLYSKNITTRLSLTKSEIIAINTIVNIKGDNTILIDQYPLYYLQYCLNAKSKSLTSELISKDFSGIRDEIIIIRTEILNRPFGAYDNGVIKIDYNPITLFDYLKLNKIYDSKSIEAYTY